MCGDSGADVPRPVEKELLRILVQEKREDPEYLPVEKIVDRLEADYGADTIERVIDTLDDRPNSVLKYLSLNEDCVTIRDLDEAGERLDQLIDEQGDFFE